MTYPFCLLSFSLLIFKRFFFFFFFFLSVLFFIFIWADLSSGCEKKWNDFTFVLCVCFSLISYFGPVLSKKNGIRIAFRFNVPCFSVTKHSIMPEILRPSLCSFRFLGPPNVLTNEGKINKFLKLKKNAAKKKLIFFTYLKIWGCFYFDHPCF